ncbi:MAG: cytidylate kinase-like family protein [Deltaproteobacteria bacterium]|nr:cytidylate kinase-like family protein [Deltaproteobacteria bacterium]MBW1748122.1 cytidylate kinase-like family protein [Deltaproteobacteria bacterium]MBW1826092.1 cytidylate kinase-like family protein [Deltaproteobacteria bacterium]MBW1968029.1 cytidylate kinase-like family protein [Deltaproteobacteria bacterium]MBW2155177.1 cytidylate kinase-like family protein [Deltaproteobacteria bacterium]
MKPKTRSIEQIIEEQVRRWQIIQTEEKKADERISVITISREPGSGGNILGERLSQQLQFDLFYQEFVHQMAENAHVSVRLLETLDEKGASVLEEWISSLVDKRHLWPDRYLQHLMKIIGTIGKHGRAVIVGRGANFVLPPEKRISLRVISPLETRIRNVSQAFGTAAAEARSRILKTESDRKAFIKKYFNEDIQNPLNYDVIINTEDLSVDDAVNAVIGTLGHLSRT